MISTGLIEVIRAEYQLDWDGIHGVRHWARVFENGMQLAEVTGADLPVIELFAVFHDSRRINEDADAGHGLRGAEFARKLRGKVFELSDSSFTTLYDACRLHTDGLKDGDITVQICWDADRLDLGRVGIFPDAHFLCTPAARNLEVLQWANSRACSDFETAQATEWLSRK